MNRQVSFFTMVILLIIGSNLTVYFLLKEDFTKGSKSFKETKFEETTNERIIELERELNYVKEELEDLKDNVSYDVYQNDISTEKSVYTTVSVDEKHNINRGLTSAENISWVVMHNGEVVLQRNAEGETQYKYFKEEPGVYTVYLEAWIDGAYRPISNTVSYVIK